MTFIDYSDSNNWLRLDKSKEKKVDLIYIYPNSYSFSNPKSSIFCDINDIEMRKNAEEYYKTQASLFEENCNIFAPYYRQADALSLCKMSHEKANNIIQELPYEDIYHSLEYYFSKHNNGRPFILAGHSQGSMIIKLVLEDFMNKNPYIYDRMIAAYVLGCSIDEKYMEENTHLKFAECKDDYGVIISYNTESPKNYNNENFVVNGKPYVINPITWSRGNNSFGSVFKNLGSYINIDGTLTKVMGIADAKLDTKRGVVLCQTDEAEKYKVSKEAAAFLGEYSYHSNDYGFYYFNLQKNVKDRINAYLKDYNEKDN